MEWIMEVFSNFWAWLFSFPPSVTILFFSVSIGAIVSPAMFIGKLRAPALGGRIFFSVVAFLIGGGLSYIIILTLFTEQYTSGIHGRQIFLSKDRSVAGDIVEVPCIIWNSDLRFRDYDLVKLEGLTSADMTSSPITENPKVRYINYKVILQPIEKAEDALKWDQALTKSGLGAETWLKFQLYNFNEMHSKEIAKLYNPLDQNQQTQLKNWVEAFLKLSLEESGRSLQSASFTFDEQLSVGNKTNKGTVLK